MPPLRNSWPGETQRRKRKGTRNASTKFGVSYFRWERVLIIWSLETYGIYQLFLQDMKTDQTTLKKSLWPLVLEATKAAKADHEKSRKRKSLQINKAAPGAFKSTKAAKRAARAYSRAIMRYFGTILMKELGTEELEREMKLAKEIQYGRRHC